MEKDSLENLDSNKDFKEETEYKKEKENSDDEQDAEEEDSGEEDAEEEDAEEEDAGEEDSGEEDSGEEDAEEEDAEEEDSGEEDSGEEDAEEEDSGEEDAEEEDSGEEGAEEEDSEEEDSEEEEKDVEIKSNKLNLKLASEFKKNINKIDFDKNLLKNLQENISTKNEAKNYLNAIELLNSKSFMEDSQTNVNGLYPHLDDPRFNIKIFNKREFNENKMVIEKDKEFDIEADRLCNLEFELSNHQKFIKNFLSIHSPFNSLLLFHGLGTGKTCSAIGVAEEMRNYMSYMDINNRIIIVASPNVQENFKLQLFDERKLENINNKWVMKNCAGNNILKEINNMNQDFTREKVIRMANSVINTAYLFLGYIEFANLIIKKGNNKSGKQSIKAKLQNFFGNRLIIIDEIHNIRKSNDNSNKLVATEFYNLVKNVDNLKLLLLSATPMFNDYKEIIFLINIMNMNDKRSIIDIKDVFNKNGDFIINEDGEEVGKELLIRKLRGYVSYVKGDNPYSFPFRILPNDFEKEKSIYNYYYPKLQLNGKTIEKKDTFFDIYLNQIDKKQLYVYNKIVDSIKSKINEDKLNDMVSFGYTLLQKPLECLNMIFPNKNIIELLDAENYQEIDKINVKDIIGKSGINNIMKYEETQNPKSRFNYEFKDETMENIFLHNNIGKYSCKIKSIIDNILSSTGIVIIYSQFIDSGLIPIALALESVGITRYGETRSLFKEKPVEDIDVNTMKYKREILESNGKFKPAKYSIISGNKNISPNIVEELKAATNDTNKSGEQIKVILLSAAGSEGLDFKFVRQIHILEPWYNINRIEQIIGRGVRTCSHKELELKNRNVQIFMHGTSLNNDFESVDLFIYRKAEDKAKKIGKVTRLLKETSVDCLLNKDQEKFIDKNFNTKINIITSNLREIKYNVGDKALSGICDYMEDCKYACNPETDKYEQDMSSYNEFHIEINNDKIVSYILDLFKDKFFYTKKEIIDYLLSFKNYSLLHIDNAIENIINNDNYFLKDKYGNLGRLINIDDLYIFQPIDLDYQHNSMYTNINPIVMAQDSIELKIPKDFNNFEEKKSMEDKDEIKDKIKLFSNDSELKISEDCFNKFKHDYDLIYSNITPDEIKKEKDNKIMMINQVIKIITDNDLIDRTILKTLVVDFLFDNLEFNKRLLLIEYVLNSKQDNEFINLIKLLIEKLIIANSDGEKCVIISRPSEFNKYTIYMIKNVKDVNKIVIGEYEDYNDFDDIIKLKKHDESKLNNIL